MRHKLTSTNMDDNSYAIKIIPLMRKIIKKHPWSGELEAERWFKYDYKIVGITFNTDYYEPKLLIHIEISNFRTYHKDRMNDTFKWNTPRFQVWSARQRNEYVRTWGLTEMKLFVKLFSFPHRIEIGKIKLVE